MQSGVEILRSSQDLTYGTCRICYQQQPTNNVNMRLISPCECKGTSSYVHAECIEKWIKQSEKKILTDQNGKYITCELCTTPIYFTLSSESWLSWYKNKPCSAVFYFCWIFLLIISISAVVVMIIVAISTKEYLIMKYIGLPFGFSFFGGVLFYQCRKDLRDFQKNIIKIKMRDRRKRKLSDVGSNKQSLRDLYIQNQQKLSENKQKKQIKLENGQINEQILK